MIGQARLAIPRKLTNAALLTAKFGGSSRRRQTAMSKRKGGNVDRSVEEILNLDIARTLKAAYGTEQLAELVSFGNELAAAAAAELKKKSKGCRACLSCGKPANNECMECEHLMCDGCENKCDFEDGCGGEGCGRSICSECLVTTVCCRDVGGCLDCLDVYDCPDCDECAGY